MSKKLSSKPKGKITTRTPKKTKTPASDYGAKDIQVLEGLDPVRKRPGMFIGSTGPDGLHHLVWEVLDNSLDEAMAGYAKNIEIRLLPNDRVQVSDDGRGIPIEKHPQTKKSTLETVLTVLHAGGKFDKGSYAISGGLHGVGISVVNALSKEMKVIIKKDGKISVTNSRASTRRSKEEHLKSLQKYHGFKVNNIKLLANCVNPKLGWHIFKLAFKDKQETL